MDAHDELAPGLVMESCTGKRSIKKKNLSYVDDAKGMVSSNKVGEEGPQEVAQKLQISGQIWNDLQDITGQGLAYHKEEWRMTAWDFIEGKMEMIYSTNERVVLEDGKGGLSVIEFLGPDKPVTALGFTMSLDGN